MLQRLLPALVLLTLAATAFAGDGLIPVRPKSWVTDTAGLLSPAARGTLDRRLAAYERQTGHQVAVWIGTTLASTPLEDFAVSTFKAWGLGRKGKDDGLLVAVLAEDRRIAIEVGYALEARVPDAVASRVINEVMIPKLRAGQADDALQTGVDALLEAIEGAPFVEDGSAPRSPQGPGPGQIVLYLILAAAFLLLLFTNPRLALGLLFVMAGRGGGGAGGFGGGGGRSGGGGARGSW
ncbi:MAG: TPM domain-containing protein [Myxococcales bacterium]|nr:TPM domain-containing protein [Myxococcales bacterium]